MLAAMGNLRPDRLLDTRFLDLDGAGDEQAEELLPVLND
jgi:hypothetical protein